MLPSIVLPVHDPGGVLLPHLYRLRPQLADIFKRAFISLSPATEREQAGALAWLQDDPYFKVNTNLPGSLPGEHFLAGYRSAVCACPAEQVLHLCDIDRVAFILSGGQRATFLADLKMVNRERAPVLFQRSEAAWATYPHNYREVERLLTRAGELLFGRSYDFAWSHLAMRAGRLAEIIPQVKSRDFGVLIEMVLLLRDELILRPVDWLAWEDAFILGREAEDLRQEREGSQAETLKRLRGILPMFKHLQAAAEAISGTQGEFTWERAS